MRIHPVIALALCATPVLACRGATPESTHANADAAADLSDTATSTPEPLLPAPTRFSVDRPTIVAFWRESTEAERAAHGDGADEALADFANHFGRVIDDLQLVGFQAAFHEGDSVPLVIAGDSSAFVPEGTRLGLLFADPAGHHAVSHGVATDIEILAMAMEFLRTGAVDASEHPLSWLATLPTVHRIDGPTLFAFFPAAPSDSSRLREFGSQLHGAMSELWELGFAVAFQEDSVRLSVENDTTTFQPARDSGGLGYLLVDSAGRREVVYGLRTSGEIVEMANGFLH